MREGRGRTEGYYQLQLPVAMSEGRVVTEVYYHADNFRVMKGKEYIIFRDPKYCKYNDVLIW